MRVVVKEEIINSLKEVGIENEDTLIVHTSLKSIGYVTGGAQTVIEALLETVTYEGTVVMPTQSWKNSDPDTGVHWEVEEKDWQIIRDNWPAYDSEITPTNTMGAVAEMFRKYPGSKRSDHPQRSFAANGRDADYIVKNHDLNDIFGKTSPLAKLYELDAKVLLIGVGYDKCTGLHLADYMAAYPGKHNISEGCAMMVEGKREWVKFETLFVDGEDFIQIGADFEKEHNIKTALMGDAEIKVISLRNLVDYAVLWIEQNRKGG